MNFFKLNKKQIRRLITGVIIFAGCLAVFLIFQPLVAKRTKITSNVALLEEQFESVNDFLKFKDGLKSRGKLVTLAEVSGALDAVTKLGMKFKVDFLSMSQQPVAAPAAGDLPCRYLPVTINVQAQYEDLGKFLSALGNIKDGVIAVSSLRVWREDEILPLIKGEINLQLYIHGEQ